VGVGIEWKHFNAGPSAMEALLAGALDLTYVGPSPAINVHVRSGGKAIRIVSGAASGGALLIVRKGAGITTAEHLRKKKVAAPEIGNTQDVALRHWLKTAGLRPVNQGGDVEVLAIKNPDILSLFQRQALDAAWVPEPWATRLLHEGDGEILLDERTLWPSGEFTTVVLVARTEFLEAHRELVERFVQAHRELTDWITQHPEEAKAQVNQGLAVWLGQPLPAPVLDEAWERITFTVDPVAASMATSAAWAWELGYVPGEAAPTLDGLFDVMPPTRPAGNER
jgi:NitT/TauT family transport system substrate-binding protein